VPLFSLGAPVGSLAASIGLEAGARDQWFLVCAGALSLLAEAAQSGPLLCLIEDAHGWTTPRLGHALGRRRPVPRPGRLSDSLAPEALNTIGSGKEGAA
jgi:hypothetical protein